MKSVLEQLFYFSANTTYAVIQRYNEKQTFSSLFKSSSYFNLLKEPLNSCFSILFKDPCDIFDTVQVGHVIKHCIVFDVEQQLIVTELSAYHEHD